MFPSADGLVILWVITFFTLGVLLGYLVGLKMLDGFEGFK